MDGNHQAAGSKPDPVRVLIVGGGCAGLATAWTLHRLNLQPDGGAKFEIHVYESSHKLGGKGASERDAHGRILEHGLHVWLGFYENAFRLMREVYAEAGRLGLGPDAEAPHDRLPCARFDDAFRPEPHIGVASPRRDGGTDVWSGYLPPMKGEPGTPLDEGSNPFTWWGYAARALALVKALMLSTVASAAGDSARSALDEAVELDFEFDPSQSPGVLIDRLARLLRAGALTTAAGLLQGVTLLENWLRDGNPAPQLAPRIFRFAEALTTQARRQLCDLAGLDEATRRKTEILDLVMTVLVGLWRDRVYFSPRGLDAIDHIDYRAWLLKHGATQGAIASPLITGIYDLVFGYRDGHHDRPDLSAGQAIRGALRMFFTYRGSMFWRLDAGMGDVVFAPLFRLLLAGGVQFHFGQRLDRIMFSPSWQRVEALSFSTAGAAEASRVHSATAGPWPLDDRGCWPTAERSTLPARQQRWQARPRLRRAGRDFDAVVFAQGVDAFVTACGETATPAQDPIAPFFLQQPHWDAMRRHVRTVATCSAQVWLDRHRDELGWARGAVVVAGLNAAGKPRFRGFETWADMTHTLAAERRWRYPGPGVPAAADRVQSIAYFCGVLDDQRAKAGVAAARQTLQDLLRQGMAACWPGVGGNAPHGLQALVSADGQLSGDRLAGEQLLEEQFVVVNAEGSARYTQALPGGSVHRLSPLEPWFENATIAGDWTNAGFNGGCVETAVMSGLLAAHALSGRLDLNAIVGYHHP